MSLTYMGVAVVGSSVRTSKGNWNSTAI